MASVSEKRLVKEFLDLMETPKLCEIVRSVYHGGGVVVNTREDAEMLLVNQPYERILSSRRIPIAAILKFLIMKGYNNPKPVSSRYEVLSAFKLLIESQPDYVQPPASYTQQVQSVTNNMRQMPLNDSLLHHQPYREPAPQRYVPPPEHRVVLPDTKSKKEDRDQRLGEFIELFAQHFYVLFNHLGVPGKDQLDNRHFYENCTMVVKIVGGCEEIMKEGGDSASTLQCLLEIKKEHQLFFSPNVEDGVKWKKESHGLVNVHVGGTLHQGVGRMVGMFEQQFILREDPLAVNTYKILRTTLMMKNMDSMTSGPRLSIEESQSKNLQIEYA